jgi:ABC-type nitrate/sulfonate/bicarbonate transport system ATPase subunit
MAKDEAFRTRIARAREAQQDALMDETLEMADAATAEDWQVVELRIWARQWLAAKLAPKKYGEAMLLKHAGNDGQNLREMSDGDAAARVAAILEAARRRENLTALRDSGAAQSEPCRSDHA